jgi:bifunctional non-homologous end joining protein LigD
VARPLDTYDSMRDFDASPEPPGRVGGSVDGRRRFLVQRHRARRLHYDFRIELDGALVSWAVPKGPSLDPAVKRMAVKVEDHPFAYGWFEGLIPSGYGQGDVIVWDDGWWDLDPEYPDQTEAATALEQGELKFVLVGRKLRGRFVILRTKGGRGTKPGDDAWLMIHKRDEHAVEGWDAEDYPVSVLSGRTNVDVVENRPGRWPAATDDELETLRSLPAKGGDWSVDGVKQAITNLDKVMMPGRDGGPDVTKRDVIAYYASVAPWMSMSLSGRPINLNRFPDGIGSTTSPKGSTKTAGFYHKAVPKHAPLWLRRWPNPNADDGETREYLLIDGTAALVWVANFAGFEIHPWTSTAASPDEPSYALVDIDPGATTSWDDTLTIARLYRVAMDQLSLVALPKVTGKRGVQIWIPVRPGYSFRDTATFVEALSRTVGNVVSDLISWKWRKDERKGKARLDYTQNAVNKTLVAPYSIRPAAGAPVSVPLEWDELDDPDLRPDRWTIHSVLDRLATTGDPYEALVGVRQDLPEL